MKKLLISLMALSMVAMVACSKDDDDEPEVIDNSRNSAALAQKSYVAQQTYKESAVKTADDDLVTIMVSFLDASRVRFEQALTDADDLLYLIESQTVSYSYNDTVGKFVVTLDGAKVTVSFSVVDGSLSFSYEDATGDAHRFTASATDFVSDRQATDNLAGTYWTVNNELKSRVFNECYTLINNSNIQFAFDATGKTGKMIFYNSDLYNSFGTVLATLGAANGLMVDVAYTVDVMPYLKSNFGGISINDTTLIGSQASAYFTAVDYVMVNDNNMVLHLNISEQIATFLGLPGVSEVFVPMVKTDGIDIPENGGGDDNGGDNGNDTVAVVLAGSTYTLAENAMASGYISFVTENEGRMLFATSVSGQMVASFTYVQEGASVVITPAIDESNQMLSMILSEGKINATLSNGGNTLTFNVTMAGNTIPVIATRNAE